MSGAAPRSMADYVVAAVGIAAVTAAFLRGQYLLGFDAGVVYVVIALALLWLVARSRTRDGRVSLVRVGIALLILPLGYAMAFPASFNADFQVFIDQQETDRRARVELAAVFASDAAYSDLSVSSAHTKIVNVTIQGALGSRTDLDRLRSRIESECPALQECVLHWDVALGTRRRP